MTFTPFLGTGALVNVITVAGPDVDDFENWYSFEHFLDRVDLPGFLRGRRYVGADADSGDTAEAVVPVFSIYETESVDTLTSPDYLAALDRPSEWTRRALPYFRTNARSVCRLLLSVGVGSSATIVVTRLRPTDGSGALDALGTLVDSLVAAHRILAGHVLRVDPVATRAKDATAEGRVAAAGAANAGVDDDETLFVVFEVHASLSIRAAAAALEHVLDDGPWTADPATTYTLVSERLSA